MALLVDFFGFAVFGFSFPSLNHILYIQEEGPGMILPLNRFFYSFCRPKTYDFLRTLSSSFSISYLRKRDWFSDPSENGKNMGESVFYLISGQILAKIDQNCRRYALWFSQSSWLDYHFLQKAMYSTGSMSIYENHAERGDLVWPNRPYKDHILVSLI